MTQKGLGCAGPGLGVRILGDVTAGDALEVLRQVDEVFINSIREWGLYDKIWQAFAVFLPVRYATVASEMLRGSRSHFCQATSQWSLPHGLVCYLNVVRVM
jgi:GMP synthase PP-ATPase subunit